MGDSGVGLAAPTGNMHSEPLGDSATDAAAPTDAGPSLQPQPELSLSDTSWNADLTGTNFSTSLGCGVDADMLTLHFRDTAGGLDAIVGRSGAVSFARTATGWSALEPFVIDEGTQCEISVASLAIVAIDGDDDGEADVLTGTGAWRRPLEGQDSPLELTATPDDIAPTLTLYTAELSPLSFYGFAPSEILQAGATLALEGTPDVDLVANTTEDGLVSSFGLRQVLPFGGVWTAAASGFDLAGLPLQVSGEYRTVADPGFLPTDGFEGSIPEVYANIPGAFTETAGLAIDGKSLISRGMPAFHLERADGTVELHYSLRMLSVSDLSTSPGLIGESPVYIRHGVVGGTVHETLVHFDAALVETGDAEWPYATAVLDGTIPLGDAEGDVIVELGQGCVGPRFETNGCANRTALVLDDLRLE